MKILVVLKDLYLGGIQKSGVNFVNFLSDAGIDVDLCVFNVKGPMVDEISPKVNIIEAHKSMLPFSVSQKEAKSFGFGFYLKRTAVAMWCKTMGNSKALKNALKKQPMLEAEYDIAISFAPSLGTKSLTVGGPEFVLHKTKAKQKWVFVHGDYVKSDLNEPYANSIFAQFDKIMNVSKSCAESMKNAAPEILADKIDYLYNLCDKNDIIEKQKEEIGKLSNAFNMITVARLSAEKGHIRFLEQLKKLHLDGFDFCYSIVGDGNLRAEIEQFIHDNGMTTYVKMLGSKKNPYPYIKNADLFVLPSYYEAAPMVYAESFLCGVPVLTTRTVSAMELVGDYGFVCENGENSLYLALKDILSNKSKLKEKQELLKHYTYDNDQILNKVKNGVN